MDTSRGNRMLKELLGVEHAIIQAPMAGGVTTEELVGAVSRAGGLGMIGAGGMDPEALRKAIHGLKKRNDGAFGANLFVPWNFKVTEENIAGAYEKLRPVYDHFGLEQEIFIPPDMKDIKVKFDAQLDVIVEEKVPVCSFIFGIPESHHIEQLKEAGTILLGTATTVEEAEAIERAGFDAVVLQGAEAGGHRGTFLNPVDDSLVGLMSLIPEAADQLSIPVIAAGGIMDGRGVAAARILGAAGVQLGTAFISTEESGAHPVHKNALSENRHTPSVLTKVFTGRAARAIQNTFIRDMGEHMKSMVDYPVQRRLTQPVQDASKAVGSTEYAMLLAGQGKSMARSMSAGELIRQLVIEAKAFGVEV
ncbi:NAD(P)H-dependent flavin oxidoreductase [Salinicoccus roseus]|uniref:NAD(P)H-dependent flavin oxidoreductase n=1 Tax=Salinicoccus roseus TaxID=45670 RepID=UPI003DA163D2